MTIVSPTEGAAIGTEVSVEMTASGIVIEPKSEGVRAGHGHFYVAMETDCPPEGASIAQETSVLNLRDGESSVTIIVDRGPHSLCVGVADGDDLALAARAKVSFYSY